ncbi:MAG: D-alanine--D-alanine ligase family protein [Brevinema sp.]
MSKKVVVLAGGVSAEKEISKRSGQNLVCALNNAGFNVSLFDPSDADFSTSELKKFDVVYPILHGTKGEDGVIQGVLEYLEVPYVGSNVLTSAITMDKNLTKKIFQTIDIPCPKGFSALGNNFDEIMKKLDQMGYPLFVKPISEGSSVGTLVLHNKEEAYNLLPTHLKDFPDSLIETFISGREMTVGVIQKEGGFLILPILELKPKAEFYNFETKYTVGMTDFVLPASINSKMLEKIHTHIKTISKEFNLRDCFRVDLLLTEDGPIYLEINSAPGMTATSDIPAMLNAANIPVTDFVTYMINNALERN